MRKKVLSTLLIMSLTTVTLAGCGASKPVGEAGAGAPDGNSAASGAAVTPLAAVTTTGKKLADITASGDHSLSAWSWDKNFNVAALDAAAEIYKTDVPDFTLDDPEITWDEIELRVAAAADKKDYSSMPDILLIQDHSFQRYLKNYPDLFTDLTDSVIPFSKFSESKLAESTLDGKHYGIPFDSGAEVACYRTDILEQAGYTIDDLTDIDWNKFDEIGKNVKSKTGYALISAMNGSGDIAIQMLQSCGGSIWNDDGSPNIANNDKLKQVFTILKQLHDDGVFEVEDDWNAYVASFQTGKVAAAINGCWILASVEAAEDQSGKWALTDMPSVPGVDGATNYSNQGGATWIITSNCKNTDLAEDFFYKTFAGNTKFYEQILPGTGALATYLPAADSTVYNEPSEFFGGQKVFKKIVDYSQNIPSFERGVYYTAANNAIANALTNVLNGKDIDSELAEAEKNTREGMK